MEPNTSPPTVLGRNWLRKSSSMTGCLTRRAGREHSHSGGEREQPFVRRSRSPARQLACLIRPGSALELRFLGRPEQLEDAALDLVDEDRVVLGLAVRLELDRLGDALE